jgi:CSLREA domain-containing protein
MNYGLVPRRARRALTLRPLALGGLALLAAFAFSSAAGRAFGPAAAPATIVVNSLSDAVANDGACTLREAITAATNDTASGPAPGECAAGSGDDTINFTVTGTINLNAQQLSIASTNLTINGPGSNLLTVRRDTGGLYRVLFINAATVNISGLTISNGLVPAGGGAGGGMINGGTTTLTDVVVTGNRSSGGFSGAPNGGNGGGIDNSGILTMNNCTVNNNFTGDGVLAGSGTNGAGGNGGGLSNSGTLTMTNCTVSGNGTGNGPFKGGDGGGVYSTGTANLRNVTVANNTVGGGGFGPGIINGGGSFNVRNSIVARNGFTGTGPDITGSFQSQGNNVIGTSDAGSGFASGVNGDQVGTFASPVNPLLAPLGNYGGLTQTHALLPGSSAIDAGASDSAPAQDQRGVSRVGAVDIGSFESRGFSSAATGGTPQSTTIKSNFAVQFKATVTSAFGEPVGGGRITFAAPVGAGPSGTFAPNVSAVSVTLDGSGEALAPVFTANGLAGSYNVTAGWSGVTSPATFSLTNNPAATTTTLSSSSNPSDLGESVTFTASVTSPAGVPTGTVQFKDNGADLGTPVALGNAGQAAFTTSALASGLHTITAVYSGDANFLNSTGTLSGGQSVRPTISVSDVSVIEGDSGTVNAVFNVTLNAATPATVIVNFATADDTAKAPADYLSNSGTLTFDPGQTAKTVTVSVNGDTSFEADETFFLNLQPAASNATIADSQGVGTVDDDDAEGGRIAFTSATFNTAEGSGSATVTVERTNDMTRAATVEYATSDLSASQRSDYILALGTLSFAPGETSKSFVVLINQDSYAEGTEAVALTLSNPGGGAVVGVVSTSTLEIADDVPESSGNPIDASEAFVRQHYHDFLNREPDAGGLNFWTGGIESCGADQQCRTLKRIDTSAAFFLSIEFQETGFLAHKMYKAAYGDAVGQATVNGVLTNIPVPVVRLNEFLPDTQKIGRDVIVGTAGWPARLENNKNAFALDFVTRQRFTNAFGPGVAPEQFVDALNANAGNVLSAEERAALVEELTANNTPVGRASVLRKVAEDADLASAEFNRAFVLMQYFGYLRRNPNDAPDTNYGGYNFWLTKLDEFGGDFRRAQMVQAFLDSVEYRQRFGQN